MKKRLRGWACGLVEIVGRIVHLIAFAAAVPAMRRSLAHAQVVVIYHDGGYGHSVIGPDVTRRLFRGQRCALVWFLESGRHNKHFAQLWPDLHIVLQPFFRFGPLGRLSGWTGASQKAWLAQLYREAAKRWAPDARVITVEELWKQVPMVGPKTPVFGKERDYFAVCAAVDMPSVHLPSGIRDRMRGRLDAVAGGRRLCCLYLRHRDTGYEETDSRSGSPFEVVEPAIRWLSARNWVVLITGDRRLPDRLRSDPTNMCLDAAQLDEDEQLFQLFAQTDTELFIGDSGGGQWLPAVNKIPSLLINTFPLGWAIPNSTVLWKVPADSHGRVLSAKGALLRLWASYGAAGIDIRNNTGGELIAAVEDVVAWLDSGRPIPETHLFDDLPDGALLKTIPVRISPAWPPLRIS